MRREGDIIPLPAIADERRDDPAIAIANIAGKERPEVVAAEMIRPLDDPHVEPGPSLGERERNKSAGQPATDDGDVAGEGRGHDQGDSRNAAPCKRIGSIAPRGCGANLPDLRAALG